MLQTRNSRFLQQKLLIIALRYLPPRIALFLRLFLFGFPQKFTGRMMRGSAEKKEDSVAVAIDRDKGSQYALKWTVDHLLSRGQALTLLHVKQKASSIPNPSGNHVAISEANDDGARTYKLRLENQAKELFLPFRCFCTRKEIKCNEVILEDVDIPKTLINYASSNLIEVLVLGAPSRSGLVRRFKTPDVPSSVTKGAPEFCTVYVIAKGKITSVRSAMGSLPAKPPSTTNRMQHQASHVSDAMEANPMRQLVSRDQRQGYTPRLLQDDLEIKSPFTRSRASTNKSQESSTGDSVVSFVSSGRPSVDRSLPSLCDNLDVGFANRPSTSSEFDSGIFDMSPSGAKSIDMTYSPVGSSNDSFQESAISSWSSQNMDEVEAEMKRLKLELKQTMEMYSTACREAFTAKQMAKELRFWKLEEEQRLGEARMAEEAALTIAEKERAKSKSATEAAEAAKKIAELETKKRMNAEMKALKESEEREKMPLQGFGSGELRYRRYSIGEIEAATDNFSDSLKIGEGGYGPVYQGELDHTQVAIKVLRPDAAQGMSQFQQEVEVLSCIRHPNMVLLLGACPEYGCLVYEFMANGSLEDRLFRHGNTPVLPWQLRFRIASEIGTALLFLHSTKPEPLVHRDLKPGNILLDRNFVSKISDVGLARLVPSNVADTVTQYRITSTAGTFCYIDPEYQQTGLLGIKSDVYSLGVMLLQIITAKPPMGLTHLVERAIERGEFAETLDPAVPGWPVEEALRFATMALQCAEMRKKDRPDLGKVVLPELNRLRSFADDSMNSLMLGHSAPLSSQGRSPHLPSISQSQFSRQDVVVAGEIESSKSRSNF